VKLKCLGALISGSTKNFRVDIIDPPGYSVATSATGRDFCSNLLQICIDVVQLARRHVLIEEAVEVDFIPNLAHALSVLSR
jgi:hypothetical protein